MYVYSSHRIPQLVYCHVRPNSSCILKYGEYYFKIKQNLCIKAPHSESHIIIIHEEYNKTQLFSTHLKEQYHFF